MDCSPPGSSVHGIFQARVKQPRNPAKCLWPASSVIIPACILKLHYYSETSLVSHSSPTQNNDFYFISHRKCRLHGLPQFYSLPFVYLLALAPISRILPIQSFSSNAMLIYSQELLIPESSTFHCPLNLLVHKHADISSTFTHIPTHSPL